MNDTPRLDPRPARQLTSREVARVLGGIIGGLISAIGVPETRRHLVTAAKITKKACEETTTDQVRAELAGIPNADVGAHALNGLVGALIGLSTERAVKTAIQWWLDKGLDHATDALKP